MRIEIHKAEIGPLTKAIERACQYSKCSADHIESTWNRVAVNRDRTRNGWSTAFRL